uniref:Uncharacterized protein n=1 Tax=Arundo donax TaxID=35708 RepID=A0A0A8Y6X4_ARUDO
MTVLIYGISSVLSHPQKQQTSFDNKCPFVLLCSL